MIEKLPSDGSDIFLCGVLDHFGLYLTGSCTPLDGLTNQVFAAHCKQGCFVIKSYTSASVKQVENVIRIMRRLRGIGLPVNVPVKSLENKEIIELEGKVFTVEPYVEGRSGQALSLEEEFQENCAFLLARLHRGLGYLHVHNRDWGPIGFWKGDKFYERLKLVEDIFLRDIEKQKMETTFYKETAIAIALLKEVDLVLSSNTYLLRQPYRLIHGDYWAGNLIVDSFSNKVICVLDFENMHFGPPILDVAQFVSIILAKARSDPEGGLGFPKVMPFLYHCLRNKVINPECIDYLHRVILIMRTYSILWILENHYVLGYSKLDSLLQNDISVVVDLLSNFQEYTLCLQELRVTAM